MTCAQLTGYRDYTNKVQLRESGPDGGGGGGWCSTGAGQGFGEGRPDWLAGGADPTQSPSKTFDLCFLLSGVVTECHLPAKPGTLGMSD